MNPTSLLNVPTHLIQAYGQLHRYSGPMASASDRSWSLHVCAGLIALLALVAVALG